MQTEHQEGAAILQSAAAQPGGRSLRSILKTHLKVHWRPIVKDDEVSCEGCDWTSATHGSAGKASYRYVRHIAWLTVTELGVAPEDFGAAVAFLSDALRDHRPHRHTQGSHCLSPGCEGLIFSSANKASNHQCDAVVHAILEGHAAL